VGVDGMTLEMVAMMWRVEGTSCTVRPRSPGWGTWCRTGARDAEVDWGGRGGQRAHSLGLMWRSLDATPYTTEKVGLPGAVASPGRQETPNVVVVASRPTLVSDCRRCGEVVWEGEGLPCGHRGLSKEAHHPRWQLWEMSLGVEVTGGSRSR
jgi:hypothetical protein